LTSRKVEAFAAIANAKRAGVVNPLVAQIEAKQNFAQADQIPTAIGF